VAAEAATRSRHAAAFGASREFLGRSGLLLALIILFVVLAVWAPNFLTTTNLLNVLRQAAFVGIIAFGMTLVIIGGEIDISVGSAVALSSALLGVLHVNEGWPLELAVLAVIAEGTIVGLAAGFLRARFDVPSFIVTLALFISLRGVALWITNAFPISIPSESFDFWGAGYIFEIPVPALIMLLAFVVFWFISTRTVFGRSVYAVGGNADAARLSGIPVERIRIILLGITGCLAAVTGVLLSSRLASGNANIAVGLEFDVIAAVIIGGTVLFGGRGSMFGTLLGVLFISILSNGLVLLGVNPFAQEVARGAIVLVAVLVSAIQAPKAGG
jgi:sugar transport system permease protein